MTLTMINPEHRPRRFDSRLTDRERKLLIYLWKWKLVSHAALAAKFFGNVSDVRAYNKLRDLRRSGLIYLMIDDERRYSAWALSAKGFKVVSKHLAGLRESGFRPEHFFHDFLVTAFHLGEWLINPPQSVRFFSEQQLRRLLSAQYPPWVPATDDHRPDGYWGFEINGTVVPIAIEMEISRKNPSAYLNVAEYYAGCERIRRVFWVVSTAKVGTWIQSKMSQALSTKANKHNFIVLADFLKLQWQAPIVLGPERNHTVSSVLLGLAGENDEKATRKFSAAKLLEMRKSFVRPKTSESTPPTQKRPLPMAYTL